MDENRFLIKSVAICFCVFVAACSGCNVSINAHDNNSIVEAVKAGASPIQALCAIRPDDATETLCRESVK